MGSRARADIVRDGLSKPTRPSLKGLVSARRYTKDPAVRAMVREAHGYVGRYKWCRRIERTWVAHVWDDVLGLFLVEIQPAPQADPYVWVM